MIHAELAERRVTVNGARVFTAGSKTLSQAAGRSKISGWVPLSSETATREPLEERQGKKVNGLPRLTRSITTGGDTGG